MLHCETQRTLLTLPDGRRHAKGASDGERFADLKRALWYRTDDEVQVDRIHYCQARLRTGIGIAECSC